MKKNRLVEEICLLLIFSYLGAAGCTDPLDLIEPVHLTSVPKVEQFQASLGITKGGKRSVLLAWTYDSSQTNLRSWDVQRTVNDTAEASLSFWDLVARPISGFPYYVDSSGTLQNFTSDSLDLYYRVLPNGMTGNFVGEPSPRLRVIVRQ